MPGDVPTLFLLLIAISLVLALGIGYAARRNDTQYLHTWSQAMLLHGVAYVLFSQRDIAPDWLSIMVANGLLASAYALTLLAITRFKQLPVPRWMLWSPVLLVLLVLPLVMDQPRLRLALAGLFYFLQQLPVLILLLRTRRDDDGPGQHLLLGSMLLLALIFLIRAIAATFDLLPSPHLLANNPSQTLTYLTGIMILLLESLGFVFMVRDRSEHQLRKTQRVLNAIFDSTDESISMFHRDGTLLQINRIGAERFLTTPAQLVGKKMTEAMPSEVAAPRIAALEKVASTGCAEQLLSQRDGHTYRISCYPVQGETDQIVVFGTDITETLTAEAALRRSEEHFRAFFERSMVGMATSSPSKGWLEVNQALCDILGYPREELLQKTWEEITHPDDLNANLVFFNRVLGGEIDEYEMDKRFLRKDGSVVTVYMAARGIRRPDGSLDYFVVLIDDISERKAREAELAQRLKELTTVNHKLEEAQNQLLQSEKMASIGQLAAGVAHELNNPIGFVHSNLGTLETYLHDIFEIAAACETAAAGATNQADFERIATLKTAKDYDFLKHDIFQLMSESKDGLVRVRKIVQDLKDFSRVGEIKWEWADIHHCLDSTLNIVWNELKYKCTVTKHYAHDLPQIRCLASQLNQVFMNLLVNAAHAIETKGEITIATRICPGDTGAIQVEIADTGGGIPEENLRRIFDPFFTTKPVGRGTGLGLSIAWGIVGKHHGKIDVASKLGQGSRFTITLPIDPPVDPPVDSSIAPPIDASNEAAPPPTAVLSAPTF